MVKISHELPKQLFPLHDLINDYPYVLGHLMEKDKEYTEFYKKQLEKSKFSIFDNSAFELGASIDMKDLFDLQQKYQPSHLVLPDILKDFEGTTQGVKEYLSKYYDADCSYIAVLQGDTFEKLFKCFEMYLWSEEIDLIAVPYDPIPNADNISTRPILIRELLIRLNTAQKQKVRFHLLGCQNPSEFLLYTGVERQYFNSVDTSAPIIHGWHGNEFQKYGVYAEKPSAKLADNLDYQLTQDQIQTITDNVIQFKKYFGHG